MTRFQQKHLPFSSCLCANIDQSLISSSAASPVVRMLPPELPLSVSFSPSGCPCAKCPLQGCWRGLFTGTFGTLTTNTMGSLSLLLNARRITSTACWCVTPPRLSPSTDSSSYPACKTQTQDELRQSKMVFPASLLSCFLRCLLADAFHKSKLIVSLGRNLIYATEKWGSPNPLIYLL